MADRIIVPLLLFLSAPHLPSQDPQAQPAAKDVEIARLCLRAAGDLATADAAPATVLAWIERGLRAGLDPSRVLCTAALRPLRTVPGSRKALRALLLRHPARARIQILADSAPGPRLRCTLTLVDAKGKAVTDAVLRLYHANREGRYAPEAKAPGDGERNAAWFGIVRPDARGQVVVETVLPGGYHGAPPHFHMGVHRPGKPTRGGSLYFDGDWQVDPEAREDAARGVAWLTKADKVKGGYRAALRIELPQ